MHPAARGSILAAAQPHMKAVMTDLAIENLRIDPELGDGIAFIVNVNGVAHRFFVARETLAELEGTLLTNSTDLFASFERQSGKVRHAIRNTLKFGSSPKVTFLKKAFFD